MKTLTEVLEALSQPIPPQFLSSKPVFKRVNGKSEKNAEVEFVAWPHLCKILDQCTNGFWSWEIRTQYLGDRVVVEGRLTLLTIDGNFSREATGWESLEVDGFGDSTSNAEAMAMRRCCAKFGLGLYLWERDKKPGSSASSISVSPTKKGEISREEWLRKKSNYQL